MAPEWKKQAKAKAAAARQQRGHAAGQRPPLTHFLCVPLVTAASRPVLARSLAHFRAEAARAGGADAQGAIEGGAVRPVGTLHLTLGVMSLMAEGAVEEAVGLLTECNLGELLTGLDGGGASTEGDGGVAGESGKRRLEPLVIALDSLEAIHSPSSTSTLFAAPRDPTQRLMPFCERLRGLFMERGLMVDEHRPLKLHATVLNTIYARPGGRRGVSAGTPPGNEGRSRGEEGKNITERGEDNESPQGDKISGEENEQIKAIGDNDAGEQSTPSSVRPERMKGWGKRKPGPVRIDARPLIESFKDFEWAPNLKLDRIAICKMGAEKILDNKGQVVDEAYQEIAIRQLP